MLRYTKKEKDDHKGKKRKDEKDERYKKERKKEGKNYIKMTGKKEKSKSKSEGARILSNVRFQLTKFLL